MNSPRTFYVMENESALYYCAEYAEAAQKLAAEKIRRPTAQLTIWDNTGVQVQS